MVVPAVTVVIEDLAQEVDMAAVDSMVGHRETLGFDRGAKNFQTVDIPFAKRYHFHQSLHIPYILGTCLSMLRKAISKSFSRRVLSLACALLKTRSTESLKVSPMQNSQPWMVLRKH